MVKRFSLLLLLVFACASCAGEISLSDSLFMGYEGTIYIHNNTTGDIYCYNAERSEKRFTTCSTFKIPNTLIALELGIADDENYYRDPDTVKHPPMETWPEAWKKGTDLKNALRYSVVWFYQEIAEEVGKENYAKYLKMFDYGNRDISGPIDRFWLSNSLKISAKEQVRFLENLYFYRYPVKKENVDLVKRLLLLEEKEGYKLYGKTGAGSSEDGNAIGLLSGFCEKGDNIYFFALNMEGDSYTEIAPKRLMIVKKALEEVFKKEM